MTDSQHSPRQVYIYVIRAVLQWRTHLWSLVGGWKVAKGGK